MINMENREENINLIAGRIIDEYRKHPDLEWYKIAASKIHSQWFEYYENQNKQLLDEIEKTKQFNLELIYSNKFKDKNCLCLKCSPIEFPDFRFNVCSICGNKRCPHASDHNYKCTNSNEPNQFGSVYCEHPKQVEEIEAENKYHFAREILFTLKSNQSITETAYLYWIDKLIQDEKIFKNQK